MILTLTPNPSTDRTITLGDRLERGAVLRAVAVTSQAAGKGVNISRAAVAAGVPTAAVLAVRRHDAFALELEEAGITCHAEEPDGEVRTNITLTEPDGTTTKINSPGTPASADLLERLRAAVHAAATRAAWVVLAGSLPPGAPPEWYADIVADLRSDPATRGVKVAVDTSDEPLLALASRLESSAPDLLKPNAEELASLTGADPTETEADPAAAAHASRVLVDRGVGAVLATLGGNGAVLVTAQGAWHARPPATAVVSTVGAGDSSLFGYLLGSIRELGPDRSLRLAVAYGSAACALPGTTIPAPRDLREDLVLVSTLDVLAGHHP